MDTVPEPLNLDHLDDKRVELTVVIAIPARTIGMAEPMWGQVILADAALHLAEDEPNKAVAILLGAALEASCRRDGDQTDLAVGAAIHLLKGVAESQAQGVTA
jgi:hypothetical protein